MLCLIVDGEPNAEAAAESQKLECFPEAVRFEVAPDGEISQVQAEPIAADVRPGHDDKTTARLRLIAGLIGVSFDELRQREHRRRVWRWVQLTFLVLLISISLGAVWQWQEIQKTSQRQRQAIENYVSLGQKELDAGNSVHAALYLNEAYKLGGDSLKLRYLLARALPALDIQGDRLLAAGPPIIATAFEPRGHYLLTCSRPSTVKVWDAIAGTLVSTLGNHQAPVSSAVFSADGENVLTASYDRTAKIWEARTGRLLRTFEGHNSLLSKALYSPDGTVVFTLGLDGSGCLWDAASGKILQMTDPSLRMDTLLILSPDGRRLVTETLIWDIVENRVVKTLVPPQTRLTDARFSPDGTKIVTANDGGAVSVWKADDGKLLATWIGGAGPLVFTGFLSDNRTVIILTGTGTIHRWDSTTQQVIDTWQTGISAAVFAGFDMTRAWLVLMGPEAVPIILGRAGRTGRCKLGRPQRQGALSRDQPSRCANRHRRSGWRIDDVGLVPWSASQESNRAQRQGSCGSIQPRREINYHRQQGRRCEDLENG